MKALLMCGVLSLIGLFACVEPEAEPAPAAETAVELSSQDGELATQDGEPADEAAALWGGGTCCIDYVCPTNGFETIGCKSGSTGPGSAFRACQTACGGMYCDAGEWYCE